MIITKSFATTSFSATNCFLRLKSKNLSGAVTKFGDYFDNQRETMMNKMLAPQPIREFTIGTVRWPNGYANDAVITETKVMARSFAEARRIVKQQRRSKQ